MRPRSRLRTKGAAHPRHAGGITTFNERFNRSMIRSNSDDFWNVVPPFVTGTPIAGMSASGEGHLSSIW